MTKFLVQHADGSIAFESDVAVGPPGPRGETGPQGPPGPSGSSNLVGTVYFDTFFPGADDTARILAMNEWAKRAAGPTPVILFDSRQYTFNKPIMLYSGLKLMGAMGMPAREYSRSTIFHYNGPADTSMLAFPGSQSNQSYPSDGSPRDISIYGVQFQGSTNVSFIQQGNPADYRGKTLWYCQFHNCGWKSFKNVWWGAGTGTVFSGVSHFQGIQQSPFWVGGSECSFFVGDYSFADTQFVDGSPFIRSHLQKSVIGNIMITARKSNYMVCVETGHNLVFQGTAFDAQSSDPVYGPAVKIRNGDAITFNGCSFKGVATNPTNGGDGSGRGWVDISGGRQISFIGNNFRREGNSMPAPDYPLLYVSSRVSQVKWGLNNYSNFGMLPVLRQEAPGSIINLDPTFRVM